MWSPTKTFYFVARPAESHCRLPADPSLRLTVPGPNLGVITAMISIDKGVVRELCLNRLASMSRYPKGSWSMLRVGLLVTMMFLIFSCPVPGEESESADQPHRIGPQCPKTPLEASKLAEGDVARFKKMYSSGTWTGFQHQFRSRYSTCPDHIKQIYLGAARHQMSAGPPRVGSFQLPVRK